MAKRKRGHDDGRSGVPQSSKKVKVASQSKDDERSRRRAKSKEEALPSGQIPVKADQAASPIEITQKSANVANRGSHLYQAENSERSTKKRSRSGKSKVNREPTSMFNVMPYSAKREVDNLRQNPVHIQERIETSNNAEAIPDAVVTQKGDLTPLRLPARDDEVSLQVSKSKKKRMKRKERRRKSHSTGDQPNKQGMSTQASSHVLHDQVQVRDAGSTLEKGIQQKRQQDKGKDLKTITSIPAQVPVGTRQGPGSPIARPDVDVEVRHSQSQRNSNQKASALHTPDAQMEEANTNKSIALDPKLSKRGGQLSTDKFQRSKQRTKTAIEQSLLDQARQEKRLAKQERRLQRRKLKDINKSQVSADEDQAASTELGRRIAKSKKGQMRPKESPSWSMSKVSGGQLVDVDPGFSDDEKFVYTMSLGGHF